MPGAIHLGCSHDGHTECVYTTRRAFLKGGVAIVGGAGLATVIDSREVLAQVRVFPPPPPVVSPIEGLMDTHVHAAPDVFGRSLDDEEVASLYKERGLEALVLKKTSCRLRTELGSRASTLPASKYSEGSSLTHRSAE